MINSSRNHPANKNLQHLKLFTDNSHDDDLQLEKHKRKASDALLALNKKIGHFDEEWPIEVELDFGKVI